MFARITAISILLILSAGLRASGPYSPPRVSLERDEVYETGKAIYWGDVKIGQGTACADCHSGKEALNHDRLLKIKFNLEGRVNNCIRMPERTNGVVQDKQLEALVHYLAKRYRL